MIDLVDSFFEGVKISTKNNLYWKSIQEYNGCWVEILSEYDMIRKYHNHKLQTNP